MFTRPALLATCLMNQPYFCRVNNRVAMESYLLIFLFLFVMCCSYAIVFLCKWKLQKTTKQASERANFAKRQEQELEQVKIVSKLCKGKSKTESSECHCTIYLAEGLTLQCFLIILHAYAGVARMCRTERSKSFLSLACIYLCTQLYTDPRVAAATKAAQAFRLLGSET